MAKKKSAKPPVAVDALEQAVHCVRGHRIMLDADLAALYQVEVKALNQATQRNIERFPEDFMFQLTMQELANLKSQIAISSLKDEYNQVVIKNAWGGGRKLPIDDIVTKSVQPLNKRPIGFMRDLEKP